MTFYSVILRFRADPSPNSMPTGIRRVTVRASSVGNAIKQAMNEYTGPWFVRATVIKNGKTA